MHWAAALCCHVQPVRIARYFYESSHRSGSTSSEARQEDQMLKKSAWCLVGLFIASQFSLGQGTTGTILGVVRDSTGAIVPGGAVAVRNVDTGTTRNGASDEQGRYRMSSLPL